MHSLFLRAALLLLPLVLVAGAPREQAPRVVIDPRMELATIVFRLAGNPEYNSCLFPSYESAIDRWFGPYRDHAVIAAAIRAREENGVGYDAAAVLAVHLDPDALARGRASLRGDAAPLTARWRGFDMPRFVSLLDDFVRRSRFTEFMTAQAAPAAQVRERLQTLVGREVDFSWFGRFFGPSSAEFVLSPGLCNGPSNFGPRYVAPDGRVTYYAFMQVGRPDSNGVPRYFRDEIPIIVHEFSHSFVNPVLDRVTDGFHPAIRQIYDTLAAGFRSQAIGEPRTMLNESVVRAAVIRYLHATRGAAAATAELHAQLGLGFVWMEQLVQVLGEYELDRARYRDLAAFAPRLQEFYRDIAPQVPDLRARFEARRPRLVEATAALLTQGDTAGAGYVLFRFDRPMRAGYGFNHGPGGAATFPALGAAAWDSSRTTLRFAATLVAGRRYEMTMLPGFISAEGIPTALQPIVLVAGAAR